MSKTIEKAVKRIKQQVRISKAYDMPIVNIDLSKNDENVRKFFEQFKKQDLTSHRPYCIIQAQERENEMKNKFPIIEKAKRQARLCFLGIAIPTEVKNIDGEDIQVEKVLKFNRTALKNIGKRSVAKVDPRVVGCEDKMRFKVGKPGSAERVEALIAQYASLSEDEMSPFED